MMKVRLESSGRKVGESLALADSKWTLFNENKPRKTNVMISANPQFSRPKKPKKSLPRSFSTNIHGAPNGAIKDLHRSNLEG
jgi:hypothetical protein